MEEEKYLGRIGVALGDSKEVEIVVADIEVLGLSALLAERSRATHVDAFV